MGNNTNIIFSSWPSAGGTTAARFIALIFEMKYVYAGGTLKYWADSMGYDSKTTALTRWEQKYHDYWDIVWEGFIAKHALNSTNTLIEGMTAGFLLHSDKVFKIFIKANLEARNKRAQGDGRTESLEERDKLLERAWRKSFGIEFFGEKEIAENYDFVLDTSNIGIREVWVVILKKLHEAGIKKFNLESKLEELEELYEKYTKDPGVLKRGLEQKGLILESKEILRTIKSEYPDLIKNIPEEMRNAM